MKQVFISDLHLDADRPDLTGAFFDFLDRHCRDTDELYILGDFFEVWLGDDDRSDFSQSIISALAALSCRKYVMHGNRDFLIGEVFCDAAGAVLLDDPHLLSLDSGPVLLMHGDSLCTMDKEYMAARQLLRSPDFQADFLARSLEERAAIAREIRGKSKAHTRETAADIMDVTPEEVVTVMNEAGVKTLIHGHTHRPDVHDLKLNDGDGKRYVLGDWHTSTRYLEIVDNRIELKEFSFG